MSGTDYHKIETLYEIEGLCGECSPVPFGFCHCGCGQRTAISKRNCKSEGAILGQPKQYIRFHHSKISMRLARMERLRADPKPIFVQYDEKGPYCLVTLTKGQTTKISPEDWNAVSRYSWRAQRGQLGKCFYAVRNSWIDGVESCMLLSRFILGLQKGDYRMADHIDHNTLDNRRENLRIATPSQSACNTRMRSHNRTGFKGVIQKRNGKYISRVHYEGRHISGRQKDTPEEAHADYCRMAAEIYGEFAYYA